MNAPRTIRALAVSALSASLLAACGSSSTTTSSSAGAPASTGANPPTAASAGTSTGAGTSTTASSSFLKQCAPAQLKTHSPGTLTVATDSPAYPPYFEDNKPTNGKGFESAVAYAVASKLGYQASQVKWVVEPFDSSYAPGPKSFDFDINEISITKARAQEVDFSTPYYTNPQALIVASDSPLAKATSLAAFKNAEIGVQIGTTSLSAISADVDPSAQPQVFNTSNDVVAAFKIHRVQAIAVDLATAFELVATELPHTTIAGQFSAPGGDNWGLLMAKGSPITSCVSAAVTALKGDGTLDALNKRWIASAQSVPVLH